MTIAGQGTVSDGGTQICQAASSPCQIIYENGDPVSLNASGTNGDTFAGWSGSGCSGTGSCSPLMNADRSVTATFADTTAPPAPTITAPDAGHVFQSQSGVSVQVSFTNLADPDPLTNLCKVDTGIAQTCTSGWSTGNLATGTHTAYVTSKDPGGNISTDSSRTFKVVNLPTSATISGSPGPGAITSADHTALTFTNSDTDPNHHPSMSCVLDGGSAFPCGDLNGMTLTDGAHSLVATAGVAPFGDDVVYPGASSPVLNWVTDTAAPSTGKGAGPSGTIETSSATFSFTGTDPAPGTALAFQCRRDDGAWKACSSPAEEEGLGSGAHTFQARAVDAAGNVDGTPAIWTFTVASDCSEAKASLALAKQKVRRAKAKLAAAKDGGSATAIKRAKKKLKAAKAKKRKAKLAVAGSCPD